MLKNGHSIHSLEHAVLQPKRSNVGFGIPLAQKSFTDVLTKTKSPDSSFLFQPITLTEIQLEILSIPDETEPNNYQPVPLLSNFNRILKKKRICQRVKSFLNEKEIINPSQYEFREKHSTQHAIIDIVNTIQTNMDRRLYSIFI